jgi:hypothetical protein
MGWSSPTGEKIREALKLRLEKRLRLGRFLEEVEHGK